MILGGRGKSFFERSEMTASTSIFYDLFQKDKIGHKIISTIECEPLNIEKTVVFMRNKMRDIVKRYPHFGSRIINHSWKNAELDYNRMVFSLKKTRKDVVDNVLNKPLDEDLPGWQVIITQDNCIMFIFDHVYGDGAFIANVVRVLLDDDSLNNVPLPREKKKVSLLSKILLFFKVLYLLYNRLCLKDKSSSAPWSENSTKQIKLTQFSLSELKKIRSRFSCSDGSHISINDIIHSLIVKTNSDYFNKDIISSAAMFNMRKDMGDFNDKNKLGYIILANEVKRESPPEEVLRDVHDFMRFYKETPATGIISKCMHWYYAYDREKACNLLRYLNGGVDFIISNYMFQYKDKHIQQGVKLLNIHGTVTPCDASQMYSVSTYGDNVNIYLTYKTSKITNITSFMEKFEKSVEWLSL